MINSESFYKDQVNIHLDLRMAEKMYASWKKTTIEIKKMNELSNLIYKFHIFTSFNQFF